MKSKSKEVAIEVEKAKKIAIRTQNIAKQKFTKLKEVEQILEEAKKEEAEHIQTIKDKINSILKEENLFCGVILTPDDIISVVKVAMGNKGEDVQISYNLWYND